VSEQAPLAPSSAGSVASGTNGQASPPLRTFLNRVLVLAVGRGVGGALSALWLVVLARRLSITAFGSMSVLIATAGLVLLITDHGTQLALTRRLAGRGSIPRHVIGPVIRQRLIAFPFGLGLLVVVYGTATGDHSALVPLTFGAGILAQLAYGTALTAYRATGRAVVEALVGTGSRVIIVGVTLALLHPADGPLLAAMIYAAGHVVACVGWLIVHRRYTARGEAVPPATPWRQVAALGIALIAAAAYDALDTVVVSYFRGTREAALYNAAYQVMAAVLIPAWAVGHLSYARLRVSRNSASAVRGPGLLAVAGTAAVALVVGVAAPRAIAALLGDAYAPAAGITIILLLSAPFGAAIAVLCSVAVLRDPRAYAAVLVAALAANLICNVAVVPVFGAIGAAWVNDATQVSLMASLLLVSRRRSGGQAVTDEAPAGGPAAAL
jgi:O-antigen/teichoic acid export membrane protein